MSISADPRTSYGKRSWKKTAASISLLAVMVSGLTSVALPSQAAVDQEATATAANAAFDHIYSGTNPKIVHTRTFYDGPSFSIPLSNEVASGTITTISGTLSFTQQPAGTKYIAFLCADAANTQCIDVSPTGVWASSPSWNFPATSAFAGYPAYTTFHYVVQINDGGSGSIRPALNPVRTSLKQTAQLGYTY
jgi:hypothetical protein